MPDSTVSVNPPDAADAPKDPAKAKADAAQQEKRERDQELINRIARANAIYYRRWRKLTPYDPIEKTIDPKTGQPHPSMPTLSNDYTGLLSDGRYASHILQRRTILFWIKDQSNWDYNVEKGQVTPSRPARNNKEFRQMYGELMDILGEGWG